jgi:hypothetical protein
MSTPVCANVTAMMTQITREAIAATEAVIRP